MMPKNVISLIALVIVTPIWGYILLRVLDVAEKAWKTNNKRKKYLVICFFVFLFGLNMLDRAGFF
jgi:hypothetical protein